MPYYNVYIEHSINNLKLNNQYIVVLNEEQINKLVNAYLKGLDTIKIKGVDRNIRNPNKFIIYSITDTISLGVEQTEIEANLEKYKLRTKAKKLSLTLFKKFGTNITDQFTNGSDWGVSYTVNNVSLKDHKKGKIFISHSVKDADIVTEFTEGILQIGLSVNVSEQVFNISIEDAGIKTGEDFKERIKKELNTAKAVIQIITENYKKSEACLNEMGAAWILNIPVIPFILEPISYNTVGFIHNTNQQLQLNSKSNIKTFIAQYKGSLFSPSYDDSKLDRRIELFLEKVNNRSLSVETSEKSSKSYSNEHISQAIKSLKTDNPFYKINEHSNPYYYKNKTFHEIVDNPTAVFLGLHKYKHPNKLNLDSLDLEENIGTTYPSVLDCEIWVVEGDNKQWLIFNNVRHHILNENTAELMRIARKKPLQYKTVTRKELEKLIQGDGYNLHGLNL